MLGRISARVRRHISPHHPGGKARPDRTVNSPPPAGARTETFWQTLDLIDNTKLNGHPVLGGVVDPNPSRDHAQAKSPSRTLRTASARGGQHPVRATVGTFASVG